MLGSASATCAALEGAAPGRGLPSDAVDWVGTTRATRDVDLLIEPTPDNVRRVLDALGNLGFNYAREWSVEEVLRKLITVIGDAPRVDLFTVAWSVQYVEAAADAADIEILEAIKQLRGE